MTLSNGQKEIYDFIKKYHKKHGFVPGQVIIAEHFGISQSTAKDYRNTLIKKGLLKKAEQQRGIYLLA